VQSSKLPHSLSFGLDIDTGSGDDLQNGCLEAIKQLYEIDIETTALEEFADQIQQYYRSLEERLQTANQAERPEDRMYM
jgi:proteasome assembly chaperone (PAC2) family protein